MRATRRAVAVTASLVTVLALWVIGSVRRSCARRATELRVRGMSRGVALLVVATALSALLSGCAGNDAPTSEAPAASPLPSASASPTSGPSAVPASRPTRREVVAAVKDLVYSKSENVKIGAVEDLKLARDASGTWWASASVVPASPPYLDSVTVFIRKQTTGWVLFDMGTGIDTGELPASVRDKL
jgi:hypothetical protein